MSAVRNTLRYTLVAGLAALLSMEAPLFSQVGGIRGTVTDASGALIPDVNISVTNVASGVVDKAVTNQSGTYTVPFLNPGIYRVEAAKQGFTTMTRNNLKLDVEQTARVLGCSAGTVKSQTVKGLAALRRALDPAPDPGPRSAGERRTHHG